MSKVNTPGNSVICGWGVEDENLKKNKEKNQHIVHVDGLSFQGPCVCLRECVRAHKQKKI